MDRRRVAVVGQGYVGLPVSILVAAAGHMVVGFDTDPYRILRLESLDSYVPDVTRSDLATALESGRFAPTGDPDALERFDIALIAVPTPVADGHPDLSCVETATKSVAAHLRPGCTVVLESTTYPGTTEDIVAPILETSGLRAGVDFHLGYAPERLDPGSGLDVLPRIPKIVAGINSSSRFAIAEFWSSVVETVVPAPDVRSAELAKLLENTFRLVNISLVNELTRHCRPLGVSVWDVVSLAATKPHGYAAFRPGVGAGGHCVPVDATYLSWAIRETSTGPATLVEAAARINNEMPAYVASRILAGLVRRNRPVTHANVVVIGATYKPDVPDIRNSSSLKVAERLHHHGVDVVVVDPLVGDGVGIVSELTPELVARADAIAVLVAHRGLDYPLIRTASYVFDACAALPVLGNVERL